LSTYDEIVNEGFDRQPVDPFNPPKPKSRPWFDLEDMALAIPRGVVGAVKGAYNLADTLAVDALPDWNSNPLGESKSVAGGWIEGAAHFTAGFIPFAGGFGLTGLLGEAAAGASALAKVGRVAAASGLAGFTVFEGHEARLSDLVNKHAPLVGPVADFLSSNSKDPELLGRLKNAIEQAGLGAATEGIVLGVKAVWAGKVARTAALEKGAEPAAADKVAQDAAAKVATPEKMASAAWLEAGHVDEGVTLARDHAREYAAGAVPEFLPPPALSVKVDPEFASRLADAYESAQHNPGSPGVEASYSAMKRETLAQFDFLAERGVKMEPWTGEGEPYKNSGAMRQDVRDNQHLWFLPTESTGLPADHPLAAAAGRTVNGRQLVYNDVFRAVHDYFGHAAEGNKFGPHGEEVAWQLHARMYSEDALPAMTTETRGQNSWVNYNKSIREQLVAGKRIPLAERPFAEQKAAILSPEFYNLRPTEEARLGMTGVHDLPANMQVRANNRGAFATPEQHAQFIEDAAKAYPDLRPEQAQMRLTLDEMAPAMEMRIRDGGPPQGLQERRMPEPAAASGSGGAQEPPRTAGSAEPAGPSPEPQRTPNVDATPDQQRRLPMLRSLGLNEEKIAAFNRALEQKTTAIESSVEKGNLERNTRKMSLEQRLEEGILATDLPMQNFRSPDQMYAMSRTIEDFFRSEMEADVLGPAHVSLEQMKAESAASVADMLGFKDPDAYMAATQVRGGQTINTLQDMRARVGADRTLLHLANQKVRASWELLNKVKAGEVAGKQEVIMVQFGENLQHAAAMKALVKGQSREVGRFLVSLRNTVDGVEIPPELLKLAEDPQRLMQTLQDMGGAETIGKVMDKYQRAWTLAGEGGDAAMMKMMGATYGRKFLDMTTEFFMGAVLSSPQTWVVNASSNFLSAFFLPLERALGSVAIRGSGGKLAPAAQLAMQSPIVRESLSEITYLSDSFRDAFRMFKDSGWDPQSALSKTGIADPGYRSGAITAANAGLADSTVGGAGVNWIGKAARAPMEILGGTDVVAKNTLFRSKAAARFTTEALESGLTDPLAVAQHVQGRLGELIADGQAYSQKTVVQRGIQAAKGEGLSGEALNKYVVDYYNRNFDPKMAALSTDLSREVNVATFTNRQQPGTISASIQTFVNNHPALKLVAPFINTPANLLKSAGQRADAIGVTRYIVGRIWPRTMPEIAETSNRFLQDMLSGDARRSADAIGRISVGVGAATFFTSQALSGNITGHGPVDPNQRQALIDTGWQPYSFKVGDAYISYARLDPFATFVGTAADMAEYMNHAEDVNAEDHATAITGLAVGMANNFTNKSYLTGFANLVGAMQAPEKKLPEFFRRQAASFVPNILGTAGYGVGQDPNLREVRSFADAIMAKIPGLSTTLPPRRNILGEPIERPAAVEGKDPVLGTLVNPWDPIKYSRVKDDVVRNELAALGHAWAPPKRRTNGLDLMDVPSGSTNAYDRWQELQGTVAVGGITLKDALRREIKSSAYGKLTPESIDGLESPRVARLTRIIDEYRSRAWTQMLKETPDLRQHDLAYTANKHRLRAGLPAAIIPGIQ
jgi:hypothetical protein